MQILSVHTLSDIMASGACGALAAILVYVLFLNVLGFRFEQCCEYNGNNAYVREIFDKDCGSSVNADDKLFGYGSAALITTQTHFAVRNKKSLWKATG